MGYSVGDNGNINNLRSGEFGVLASWTKRNKWSWAELKKNAFLELLGKQKVETWVVICVLHNGPWLLIREMRVEKFISHLYMTQTRRSSLRNVMLYSSLPFLALSSWSYSTLYEFLNHWIIKRMRRHIFWLWLSWRSEGEILFSPKIPVCTRVESIYLFLPRNCVLSILFLWPVLECFWNPDVS